MPFPKILVRNRKTEEIEEELVFGKRALDLMYNGHFFSTLLAFLTSKLSFFSAVVGWVYKRPFTKKKIASFIKTYGVKEEEFVKPVEAFTSFNDFFIRELKKEVRPIASSPAIIPADGRFLFYPHIHLQKGFIVKDKKFSLEKLLNSPSLAEEYQEGSMVIARLCPSDYHRFHFPVSGIPGEARLINGPLFSVNPIALQKNLSILSENKRMITDIASDHFGKVLFIEIGATCVGTIHQTYTPNKHYKKGDEKGFFSFGGSSIIILFLPKTITFSSDLIKNSVEHMETLTLFGEEMGNISSSV